MEKLGIIYITVYVSELQLQLQFQHHLILKYLIFGRLCIHTYLRVSEHGGNVGSEIKYALKVREIVNADYYRNVTNVERDRIKVTLLSSATKDAENNSSDANDGCDDSSNEENGNDKESISGIQKRSMTIHHISFQKFSITVSGTIVVVIDAFKVVPWFTVIQHRIWNVICLQV